MTKKIKKTKRKYDYFVIQYSRNRQDTWHTPKLRRYGTPKQNKFKTRLQANVWYFRQGNHIIASKVYCTRIKGIKK